jgi:hypothetical protein
MPMKRPRLYLSIAYAGRLYVVSNSGLLPRDLVLGGFGAQIGLCGAEGAERGIGCGFAVLTCKLLDLRFQSLPDEITAWHSSLGAKFGEWIDVGNAGLAMPQTRAKGRALSQGIDTSSAACSKPGFPAGRRRLAPWRGARRHSIFANEVDELALNADPVGAENARLIGRIGGF